MSKWSRNVEGYADSTAGIAIGRVSREERKIAMGKKRSCRRTDGENKIHEKAVKLRKMTDEQLVKYVESQAKQAEAGNVVKEKPLLASVMEDIMGEIGRIKGVGKTKLHYIQMILQEKLEDYYG